MKDLSHFYAEKLQTLEWDVLFGPAYKGIPLVVATAIAIETLSNRDAPYCFNRKEKKDHGEGGALVGAALQGRVVMLDDVVTAGTTVRETFNLFQDYPEARLTALVIAFDRQEKGLGSLSAIEEIEQQGVQIASLATLTDVVQYLETTQQNERLDAIQLYRQSFSTLKEPLE